MNIGSPTWLMTTPVLLFFLSANVLISVAIITLSRKSTPWSTMLGGFLLAVSLWTLTAGLDAASVSLQDKIFWSKIEHIGINSAPIFYFYFAMDLTKKAGAKIDRRFRLLWVIPVITILLAFTNEQHGLIWSGFVPSPDPNSNLIIYEHGVWFWAATAFYYLLLLVSTYLIIRTMTGKNSIYGPRALVILFSLPFPWIGNILYNFELSPWPGFDLTPLGFAISGCLLLWGISRLRLVDPSPFARGMLIESMPNGMIVFNERDQVVDYNKAAENLLTDKGFDLGDELMYFSLPDLIAKNPELKPFEKLEDLHAIPLENKVKGEPYLEISQQLLVDKKGRVNGRLFYIRDITRQKEAEDGLLRQQGILSTVQERERMGRELHDSLGQVLNYIQIQSKVILDQIEKNDTTTALANVARLINISQEANVDVRSFIHDTRPISSPHKAFLPALTQYIENFRDLTGIPVLFSLPQAEIDDLIPTEAKIQILRIIQEALSNIRKYASARSIQIIFSYYQGNLQLVVADDGVGFDPASLQKPGHFGLSIMRERAKEIGGTLEIFSDAGKGTQVILKLPLMTKPTYIDLKKLKFMIVDDHPLMIEGIRNLLTNEGLTVVATASCGEEALQLMSSHTPDMILMDMQMPGLSGPETVRRIKQDYPQVKVMMLTMADREEDLQAAIQSGANGYVLKSQASGQLFDSLERMLHEKLVISEEMARRTLERRAQPADEPLDVRVPPQVYELEPRELDILQRVAEGEGYKEIGLALNLSPHTIKYHFNKILDTLGIQTRSEAIQTAIQMGLVKGRRRGDPLL
jgi:signal transduction histidine kinase/DNA-binding NarL/FixJ family response regulator